MRLAVSPEEVSATPRIAATDSTVSVSEIAALGATALNLKKSGVGVKSREAWKL